MKSTRLVLGALVVTLHVHQPIQSAESDPNQGPVTQSMMIEQTALKTCSEAQTALTPSSDLIYAMKHKHTEQSTKKSNVAAPRTMNEVVIELTDPKDKICFDEQITFVPSRGVACSIEDNSTVRTTQKENIISERTISQSIGFVPNLTGKPFAYKKRKEIADLKARNRKAFRKKHFSPEEQAQYIRTPNNDLIAAIEQKNQAIEQLTYEKEKMLEVVRVRTIGDFVAHNVCAGHTHFYNEKAKKHVEKKLSSKKAEQEGFAKNLTDLCATAIQRQAAMREEEINAHWAPTKDMNAVQYYACLPGYNMTAPSPMTIEEAITKEFEQPESTDEKQQVALLIALVKKVWPTMQDVLSAPASIPHDILSQECAVRELQDQHARASRTEEKSDLTVRMAKEKQKLQELKMLHFVKFAKCSADIFLTEQSFNHLEQQSAITTEHIEQTQEHIRTLLAVALYDARAQGMNVMEAIKHVFAGISHESAEFLSDFYMTNNEVNVEPLTQPEHFLTKVLTKKSEDQVQLLEASLASRTASRCEAIQSLCKAEESEEGTMTEPESASSSSESEESESESESEYESESESDEDSATDSGEDTESEAPENN